MILNQNTLHKKRLQVNQVQQYQQEYQLAIEEHVL